MTCTVTARLGRQPRVLIIAAVIALLRLSCAQAASTNSPSASQAISEFGFALYAEAARTPGNIILSPFSIAVCLSMASLGASGETLEQMGQVLRVYPPEGKFHQDIRQLRTLIGSRRDVSGAELVMVNGLWAHQGCPLRPAFTSIVATVYRAPARNVDFRLPQCCDTINAWVNQNTRGRIPRLLEPGDLSSQTRLVLANALYFRGQWDSLFPVDSTASRPFFTNDQLSVSVKTMLQEEEFVALQTNDVDVVVLPYRKRAFDLIVVLPRERNGLAAIEAKWSREQLGAWLKEATRQRVRLFLPRFSVNSRIDLRATLTAMGMSDAFDQRADFARASDEPLYLSRVLHGASIETDERGTVAAATMGVFCEGMSPARIEPIIVRVDHPFLFLLVERTSGALLFMGRVVAP